MKHNNKTNGFIRLALGVCAMAYASVLAAADLTQMRERLTPFGWSVAEEADGSLVLVPSAAPEPPPALEPAAVLGMSAAARERLEASGWRVETGADGGLLLYPPAVASSASTPATVPAPAPEKFSPAARQRLQAHGWRIDEEPSGAVLLYPPADAANPSTQPASAATAAPDCGQTVQADVTLPVDSWQKARDLAAAWVSQQDDGVTVGRIRRVLNLYVVSIVDATPPFELRRQLVIREADGRVLVGY